MRKFIPIENKDIGTNTTEIIKEGFTLIDKGLAIWKSQLDNEHKINKLQIEAKTEIDDNKLMYGREHMKLEINFKMYFIIVAIIGLTTLTCLHIDIPGSIITFVSIVAGYVLRDSDLSFFSDNSFGAKNNNNASKHIADSQT